jgi:hypothetical protein
VFLNNNQIVKTQEAQFDFFKMVYSFDKFLI